MNSIKKSQLDSLVNVIVKSLLTEISDRVSVAPLKLQQMVQPLETGIKKLFPNSSIIVEHSTNLMDCVTVHFALEPKSEWPHGIYHNATHINLMINEKSGKQREGDSGLYEVEAGSTWKLPKFRKKTGNSNSIVNYIVKYFTSIYETVHAPKETSEEPVSKTPAPVSEESGTIAVAATNSPVQTRPKVMEIEAPIKKSGGQQCFVYVKSGRLAGRSVSAVKRDGLYYYLNSDTGQDECIGSELSVSEPAPKKINENIGVTAEDAGIAHKIASKIWTGKVKDLLYHSTDPKDCIIYFKVNTGDTYYRWLCKSRDSWFYTTFVGTKQMWYPVPEQKEVNEDTVTGNVAGYSTPAAFSNRGGSEKGVQGSEKLGFTLTPSRKIRF